MDEIKKLVEQIFTTDDLMAVQSLAVELQRAVFGRIQQLQRELAEASSVQPDVQSVFEVGLRSQNKDEASQQTVKKRDSPTADVDLSSARSCPD